MKNNQIELFGTSQTKKDKIGHASVSYHQAASILTVGTGFMNGYDFTLNPYTGCSFACNYCYAAFFTRSDEEQNSWGYWVKVKENALQLLMKLRKTPLVDKRIYLSSVTDPYQPIERDLELTRSLLQELIKYHDVRLVVQTRSPLVVRDIDLFQKFRSIQVNMTVTTDSEAIRKAFEPVCSSIKARLLAIQQVREANINTCITMTPLLPVENPDQFAKRLLDTGVPKFVVQGFHINNAKFVSGTREEAVKLINKLGWNDRKHNETVNALKKHLPFVFEGKSGFDPI